MGEWNVNSGLPRVLPAGKELQWALKEGEVWAFKRIGPRKESAQGGEGRAEWKDLLGPPP